MEILDQANSANHLGQISSLARRSVQAISEASYTETGDSVDSGGDIQSTASAEDVARSNAVTKKRIRGLKDRIIHFSPFWFSVTMGTGVNATLLLTLPWPSILQVVRPIAASFLILDIVLFAIFSGIIVTRYTMHPEIIGLTLGHATHSLFLGTIPMGLITILGAIGLVCTRAYDLSSDWALAASYGWWFAWAMSGAVGLLVPWMQFTSHSNRPETVTAALLLPVVPTITIAATGATIGNLLVDKHPEYVFQMWIASYVACGIGTSLALMILALYLQRLAFHHLPATDMIVTVFLPLGPTGQSGVALCNLGRLAISLKPYLLSKPELETLASAVHGVYALGIIGALCMMGLGLWYWAVAVLAFGSRMRGGEVKPEFNMGWWGFTFPLASLTLCVLALGTELHLMFLKILGTIMVGVVIALWMLVASKTIQGVVSGNAFQAPCLAGWSPKRNEDDSEKSAN
ncbi:Sulfite efflux pump SSU1 OS=Arthroderma otae (strain ATCC MYA-4605 / CBS 113480) GN=SSU1 PE=3 SV=2 [Rhizoctonia solani AG-1 IB]|uniref:Sulfite efflux pump SSU1 n=1 Tax=Thanatephorus cucumeris (strain AG1-IB / isolate 7/3/14) TaxID=1108050 RepID=A0A0B7FI60_THACB|nr:Sulfite efflux pump SSU1 OS=Arthroderma otae (strain ATCC MYA-4605 / CBS 113480) GN=SSU1 PE=3 SV=2 [Rhizoctonia solani AG-1 IB]